MNLVDCKGDLVYTNLTLTALNSQRSNTPVLVSAETPSSPANNSFKWQLSGFVLPPHEPSPHLRPFSRQP